MSNDFHSLRRIRSFVRRDSRLTESQGHALETLLPRWGLAIEAGIVDFNAIFQREAPRVLEIGFGSGVSLLSVASLYPHMDFIGIETHRPGMGSLLSGMQANNIENIRVYYADAVDVLSQCIPDNSLDVVQIFFPDPWPKRRHHKRRLIQSDFILSVVKKLKPRGVIHLATDWKHYADHMMTVLSQEPSLLNQANEGAFADRSHHRPVVTKFEQQGQRAGRVIWELQFIKRID